MKRHSLHHFIALMSLPLVATAGTTYDLVVRDLAHPASATTTVPHFVENGQVRVDSPPNGAAIFSQQAMYIIDYAAKTTHLEATRDQTVARITNNIRQIRAKAQAAPPAQQTTMEQGAKMLEDMLAEDWKTIRREYRQANASELVDGHKCLVWTEAEEGTKRLELCVAEVSSVPGGTEILAGMRTLSRFPVFGSIEALGVQFGYGEWWAGIESLNGLPILIREFKNGSLVSEATIANVRQDVPPGALLDIPKGFSR